MGASPTGRAERQSGSGTPAETAGVTAVRGTVPTSRHHDSTRLAGTVPHTASRAQRGPDPLQRDTLPFSVSPV